MTVDQRQMTPQENDVYIDRTSACLVLDKKTTEVSQVSPARARALANMKINTVRDLLTSYPRRYLDFTNTTSVARAQIGETYTICGQVYKVELKRPRPKLSLTQVTLVDGSGTLMVTFFHAPWLANQLHAGDSLAVAGKVEFSYGFKRMTNPMFEVMDAAASNSSSRVVGHIMPVHSACEKISPKQMRRLVSNALCLVQNVADPLPLSLRVRHNLMSRACAFRCIHFPHNMQERDAAKRRIAYEEVLTLQLKLMSNTASKLAGKAPVRHKIGGKHQLAFKESLPFSLTEDQQAAIEDVNAKLSAAAVANHLILGDVGTGKTVVAGAAICAAADSGSQAFLMAPTEVLAQQHAKSLGALFDSAGVTWALLTGSTEEAARERIIEQVAAGTIDILIGTHALLEPDVVANNCSLVVIDEQQRFGVNQRETLINKGVCPDVLYLTATPIPRTLALATLGNMTLSYLKQKPRPTRRITRALIYQSRGQAYDAAKEACKRGEQVYIVCPLIGGSVSVGAAGAAGGAGETSDTAGGASDAAGAGTSSEKKANANNSNRNNNQAQSIEEEYIYGAISIQSDEDYSTQSGEANITAATKHAQFLQNKVFLEYSVQLLHGRMRAEEKEDIMNNFRAGKIDVLVSTTVIEVGVDVPNATVLIVEDADRFGLSQLHQLRGRVGRGEKDAQVFLISRTTNVDARARLSAMEACDDGFELASFDLKLRREGDILGNKQHGASSLKMVNIIRDSAIIEEAHKDALDIISRDPTLTAPEHALLSRECKLLD